LFLEDTNNYEVIIDKLRDLCSEIVSRTTDLAATFQTIVLKVRTTDFKWLSKSRTLAIPINTFSDLYFHIAELYESNYEGLKIRSVSVGIKKIIYTLVDKEVNTTDELVKQINHKFGKDVVFTGDMLPNGKKV
jgi:DNA polymerase-4